MIDTGKETLILSALPFPNIHWWRSAYGHHFPRIDISEPYRKMSYRNRYIIGTSRGPLTLSIPLAQGRNQRGVMKDIAISYAENWQKNHIRSIESAYRRSPYYEHYIDMIMSLYEEKPERLADWNLKSIEIVQSLMKHQFNFSIHEEHITYTEDAINDLRKLMPKTNTEHISFRTYIQPFSHKNGFLPNLSILDLLFCEGPAALTYLQ